jgi:putative transposase
MSLVHTPLSSTPRGSNALRRGRVSLQSQVYLLTTTVRRRQRVFEHAAAATSACACFDNERLLGTNRMLAWVLMPDHLHFLLELGHDEDLEQCVSRLKSASARQANMCLGRSGALWSAGFHDHALRREETVPVVARYVIENPVRAGLVERVEDYPYWNSIWR